MYIDAIDAAALVTQEFGYRVTPEELSRLAVRGFGPPYRRLDGRKRLYRPEDVRAWANGRLGPVVETRDVPAAPYRHQVGGMH